MESGVIVGIGCLLLPTITMRRAMTAWRCIRSSADNNGGAGGAGATADEREAADGDDDAFVLSASLARSSALTSAAIARVSIPLVGELILILILYAHVIEVCGYTFGLFRWGLPNYLALRHPFFSSASVELPFLCPYLVKCSRKKRDIPGRAPRQNLGVWPPRKYDK